MLIDALMVFLATVAFGVIFKLPKRALFNSGLAGVAAWGTYQLVFNLVGNRISASFFGVVGLTIIAEISARILKEPATVFIVAGIIPLVPGVQAYFTMLYLVEGDYLLGLEQGIEAFLIAGAISAGIVFVGIFTKLGRSE